MLRAIGLPELLVIAGVAVLLFGGKKIGEFGKGLGQAIREFKGVSQEAADAAREVNKQRG